jgi:hypothetical protein
MKLQKNRICFTDGIYCDKLSTGVEVDKGLMSYFEAPIAAMHS